MLNLQALETNVLLDMLMEQTSRYTKKMVEKESIDFNQDEYDISIIMAELRSRNYNLSNISISDPNLGIAPGTDK